MYFLQSVAKKESRRSRIKQVLRISKVSCYTDVHGYISGPVATGGAAAALETSGKLEVRATWMVWNNTRPLNNEALNRNFIKCLKTL